MATQQVAHSVPLLDPPKNPVLTNRPPVDGAIPVRYFGRLLYWMHPTTLKAIEAYSGATESRKGAKCYFIGGDEGAVKIGYSIDVASRLRALQASSPVKLKVLALASGGVERERAYHGQFSKHRLHGEWFERCPEILAEIERMCS